MPGKALLVGGVRVEGDVFRFVLVVPAEDIHLILVAILNGSGFDEGRIIAALEYVGIIPFLDNLRGRQVLALGNGVGLKGRLVGSLRLQFELGFVGVVAVGTPAVIFNHLEQ